MPLHRTAALTRPLASNTNSTTVDARRYILAGCMRTTKTTEAVIHNLLHSMSMLTAKVMTAMQRDEAKTNMLSALADFEQCWPAMALDSKWHQVAELAQRAPFWFAAMWSFERFNGHLKRLIKNHAHPQASLVEHYRLQRSVTMFSLHAPDLFLNDVVPQLDAKHAGTSIAVGSMPAYVQRLYHKRVPVEFSGQQQRLTNISSREPKLWVALHQRMLIDLQTDSSGRVIGYDPDAGQMVGTSRYTVLWERFLQSQLGAQGASAVRTPSQYITMLTKWSRWAQQQADLTQHERFLCNGPPQVVQAFSRAVVGGCKFRIKRLDTTRTGKPKGSVNSYFLTDLKPEEKMQVGRFIQFYAVVPPGYTTATDASWAKALQYGHAEWLATPHLHTTKRSRLRFVYNKVVAGSMLWPLNAVMPVPIALAPLDKWHDVPAGVKWEGRVLTYKDLLAVLPKDDWAFHVRDPAAIGEGAGEQVEPAA
jgi:hypothetical protein